MCRKMVDSNELFFEDFEIPMKTASAKKGGDSNIFSKV